MEKKMLTKLFAIVAAIVLMTAASCSQDDILDKLVPDTCVPGSSSACVASYEICTDGVDTWYTYDNVRYESVTALEVVACAP